MTAIDDQATASHGSPLRTWVLRLAGLWLCGVFGITLLYFLIARVMTPTHQEDMATTQIFAFRGWQSTGVRLQPGEVAKIMAEGSWLYTPGEWHDADGHDRYPAPSFYPLPDVAGGVLLGRVSENGSAELIGRRGYLGTSVPGMIYLRINDDILSDNEGSLQVTIEVTPAPEGDEPNTYEP